MGRDLGDTSAMASSVSALLRRASDVLREVSEGPFGESVTAAVDLLETAMTGGQKLLVFGNGGSAADAQHLCCELVGRFQATRRALPAIALTTDQALLTAWSNDHGFDHVFARQIEALGQPGDVAFGISTSGNSPNVVNALRRGRALGMRTIGLTGQGGGSLAEHCDVLMAVPLTETPRIQEVHRVTYHAICAALEERLFGPSLGRER
jgi:D-sedoheptulose 7-phosphate isomerase